MVKSSESDENISGFKIEAVLRARLSPITRNKIYDYIAHTSVVNPYAQLSFESNEGRILFERRTTVLPSAGEGSSTPSHRHGFENAQESNFKF